MSTLGYSCRVYPPRVNPAGYAHYGIFLQGIPTTGYSCRVYPPRDIPTGYTHTRVIPAGYTHTRVIPAGYTHHGLFLQGISVVLNKRWMLNNSSIYIPFDHFVNFSDIFSSLKYTIEKNMNWYVLTCIKVYEISFETIDCIRTPVCFLLNSSVTKKNIVKIRLMSF